uniref:Uncharacterized protein n=1 Tax=viral metagenome TaxID=1070528 RepID=A0A6M3LLI6_9ZZZZ
MGRPVLNTITKTTAFDLKQADDGMWILTIDGTVKVFESVDELARYLIER